MRLYVVKLPLLNKNWMNLGQSFMTMSRSSALEMHQAESWLADIQGPKRLRKAPLVEPSRSSRDLCSILHRLARPV